MKIGWASKKLGQVCTLQRGFDLPKRLRETGKFPLISSSGEIDSHIVSKVEAPGVVTGRSGSIGNVFYIKKEFWPLNTVLYVKDFHGNDERFVYYLLKYFDLGKYASGAGVPTLNRNNVHNVETRIPSSIEEQTRIVAILDEAFAGITQAVANAEKNLANARELFDSYLDNVLIDKSNKWKIAILEEEIDLVTGFAFKSKGYTVVPDGIKLLRGDNIIQGAFRWDNVKRWPKYDVDTYSQYFLVEHDVVIAMDRTWVKSGMKYAQISPDDLPCLLVQRVARLRVKEDLNDNFLKYLIGSNSFTRYVLSIQTGIGVPHISGSQINNFRFLKPPLSSQNELSIKLDKLHKKTQRIEAIYQQKLTALAELKQSILQKAFAGELTTDVVQQQVNG